MTAVQAEFAWWVTLDGTLCLEDLNLGGRSLTNDLEAALTGILAGPDAPGTAVRRIVYRDSEGRWDGVRIDRLRGGRVAAASVLLLGAGTAAEAEALAVRRDHQAFAPGFLA